MDPNKVNLNNFHNLDNGNLNPYDPSKNNNININQVQPITNETMNDVKPPSTSNGLNNDIFNQQSNEEYKDGINQADNYNIAYNNYATNNTNSKPPKTKM